MALVALPPPAPVAVVAEPSEDRPEIAEDGEVTTDPPLDDDHCEATTTVTATLATSWIISGFLWKFPSEGSVHAAEGDNYQDAVYPRKCLRCNASWVSDADNEKAHKRVCRPDAITGIKTPRERVDAANLGPARRVFCAIDGQQGKLQWRYDDEADAWSDCVCLASVRRADVIPDTSSTFAIQTTGSRRLVFQVRPEPMKASNDTANTSSAFNGSQQLGGCPDAVQWCASLRLLCDLEPSEAQQTASTDLMDELGDEMGSDDGRGVYSPATLAPELSAEIRRLLGEGDTSSLAEFLARKLGGLRETPRRDLVDIDGSSLLLLTLQLCPDAELHEMIALVARFGVNGNLANLEMETPLMIAAASSNASTVEQLLGIEGVDVNLPGALGATPLHVAANSGDITVIELLLQYGADPNAVDENGWSALHYAAACADGMTAVHLFCELAPEMIDAQCSEGNTALHIAAACGSVDNVRALLETAARPTVANTKGETPYRLALQHNKIQCALAINEYQQPILDYGHRSCTFEEEPSTIAGDSSSPLEKPSDTGQPERSEKVEIALAAANGDWLECATEDGLPYYYNTVTETSSWFKPTLSVPEAAEQWDADANARSTPHAGQPQDAASSSTLGQELPLCMVPMVSLLTSLDDPTAAAKLVAERQRDRERRYKRLEEQRRRKLRGV